MAVDKAPPQFVFDIIATEATRMFIKADFSLEDVAVMYAERFVDLYDTNKLVEDIIKYVELILKFLNSVDISDTDLILVSYIYFSANYEKLNVKRNKKPMFRSILKGQDADQFRAYKGSKGFTAYVYGMRASASPLKPEDWDSKDEIEFEPIFTRLRGE
jgi:hypothetical protein